MRPLLLDLEGFTTFREPVSIDLEGAELFALAGPTGSGKSSVLDALCFALYGSVPRLDRRAVAPVISVGLSEARVRLRFAVGGRTYTAARVVRRQANGGATTKEARLESGDQTLAGDADSVTRCVEELLGLGFEQFTTCVLLPQGEFARFLHDTPKGRQQLLIRLLELEVYGRMREAANARKVAAEVQSAAARNELDRLAEATPDALAQADRRIDRLESLRHDLDRAGPQLDALAGQARDAERERVAAATAADQLDAVTVPDGVATLAEQVAAAAAALAAADLDAARAEEHVAAAERDRAALGDAGPLERVSAAAADRDEQTARVAKGQPIVVAARRDEQAALDQRAAARAVLLDAEAALEHARRDHRAADLAAGLAPGDPCPVCHRPLDDAPVHDAPDLGAAQAALTAARSAAEAQAVAATAATERRARAEAQLATLTEHVARLDAALAGAIPPDQAERRLAGIAAADERLRAAREGERAARAAARAARRAADQRQGRQAEGWRAFDAARDRLSPFAPPPADRDDLGAAWAALATWAARRAPGLHAEAAAAGGRFTALVAEHAALRDRLDAACREAGVEPGDRPRDACADALASGRAARERLTADLERAGRLRGELAALEQSAAVARKLRQHLSSNGFEQWLLDEALDRLAAGASQILRELSAGQYSLAVEPQQRSFLVIDHRNADERRPARTLSGGETFLASLALALTLASHLAELATSSAVRLESIFLDEGFGTLDPETLDVVAAALEELGARGRTVGLVTHVRDLAERLPVRFEVRRGPASSTVTKVVA
jgi:exonuclease SbcC